MYENVGMHRYLYENVSLLYKVFSLIFLNKMPISLFFRVN
jgi:hypothetical protein